MSGWIGAGLRASSVTPSEFDDWYTFDGEALAASGTGALITLPVTIASAGKYHLKVSYADHMPPTDAMIAAPNAVPDHLTRPYIFEIQP